MGAEDENEDRDCLSGRRRRNGIHGRRATGLVRGRNRQGIRNRELGRHVRRCRMRLAHLVCAPKRRATGVATAARFLDREQSAEVDAGAPLQPIYRYVVTNGRQGLHADFRSQSLFACREIPVRRDYHVSSRNLQEFQSVLEGAHRFRSHTGLGPARQEAHIGRWRRRRPERKIEEVRFAFPAVKIGDDAYWDGLFADNPPIAALCRPIYVGEGNIPEEIWMIKIEPTSRREIPTEPDDILDRRKQMEGNCAYFNQLAAIMLVNDIHVWGGFTPELLKFLEWEKPVRMPKPYDEAPDKPYFIPHMEMSPELYQKIDWEAKLDRGAENIDMLMEDGQKRAREFLDARKRVVCARQG